MEQSEEPGSHYLGFIATLQQYGRRDILEHLPQEARESSRAYYEQLTALLAHLPGPLQGHRVAMAMGLIIRAAADRELAHAEGRSTVPFAIEVADLTDGVTGFLQAPVSPATQVAVDESWPAGVAWAPFL
jgi:hypothetical protein